jgi:hypothetical protein
MIDTLSELEELSRDSLWKEVLANKEKRQKIKNALSKISSETETFYVRFVFRSPQRILI